jgi:hypothetical protein
MKQLRNYKRFLGKRNAIRAKVKNDEIAQAFAEITRMVSQAESLDSEYARQTRGKQIIHQSLCNRLPQYSVESLYAAFERFNLETQYSWILIPRLISDQNGAQLGLAVKYVPDRNERAEIVKEVYAQLGEVLEDFRRQKSLDSNWVH